MDSTARAEYYITPKYCALYLYNQKIKDMTTILNSIAIICLSIAFALHLIKIHKPIKFEITEEELEKQTTLQMWLEESKKAGEELSKKAQEILSNVHPSNRNSES